MRTLYSLIILLSFFLGNCQAGVIEIQRPRDMDYVYNLEGARTFSTSCSPSIYYMDFKFTLPPGFSLIGNIIPGGGLTGEEFPKVSSDDYPRVEAVGPRHPIWGIRAWLWPINAPWGIGLHWLCGTEDFSGSYSMTLPQKIKIRGDKNAPEPSEELSFSAINQGKWHQTLGIFRTFSYKKASVPQLDTVGKIIAEDYLHLKAGEIKKTMHTEGIVENDIQICWQKVNGDWFDITDSYGNKIYSNCLKSSNLPIFIKVSDSPPIGVNEGAVTFSVKMF